MSKEIKNKSIMANIASKVNTLQSKSDFNYKNIDIDLLVQNEKNQYGLRDIEELAEGIKELGLLQALLVEPIEDTGKYKIIAGHRRYAAIKLLGWEKVECKIREEFDNIDSEIALHKANDFRELTPSEKASKIAELERLYKLKKDKGDKVKGKIRDIIGQDMNMSGMQVQRLKNIHYKLIKPLKDLLDSEKITMANASEFATLSEEQQEIVYKFLEKNINASKSELKGLKEALKRKYEEKQNLEKEKQKLNMKVIELQSVAKKSEYRLKEISENIEVTKKQIKEEVEKEETKKNLIHLEELNKKLESLELDKQTKENEKEKIKLEKDKEIYELKRIINEANSNSQLELEELKLNAEIKLVIKDFQKSSSGLITNFNKLSDEEKELRLSDENIELIKNLKVYKKQLDDILNKYL